MDNKQIKIFKSDDGSTEIEIRVDNDISYCKSDKQEQLTHGSIKYKTFSLQYPTVTTDVWCSNYGLKLSAKFTNHQDLVSYGPAENHEADGHRGLKGDGRIFRLLPCPVASCKKNILLMRN